MIASSKVFRRTLRRQDRAAQSRAPLFEAIRSYAALPKAAFHTPGHKQGRGTPAELLEFLGENVFRADLTELPEVDNLHDPDGVIREAQELAASAYGADRSWFLVNGSTCGVETLMMAVCDPGDVVLLPRNCHKSAIAGVMLSGAIPAYIEPDYDRDLGIAHGLTPAAVEAAIQRYPSAKGVLAVSPTYYGVASDLEAIAAVVRAHNLPFLVDEAWGPHFAFHPELPISALEAGADLVVQSTHKVLAGMTQASLLHVRGDRIDRNRVRNILQLLQSTSPNYVLMMSLDVARRQMALQGEALLEETLRLADEARARLNRVEGIQCFGTERLGSTPGFHHLDRTRLTVTVSDLGLFGFEADDWVNRHCNVQPEMSTLHNVVFIVSIGNTQQDIDRLVASFEALSRDRRETAATVELSDRMQRLACIQLPQLPPQRLSPRAAFFSPIHRLPLQEAIGKVCAEIISPYPPGIPILVPGEEVTSEAVEYLLLVHQAGGFINGPEDVRLQTLKVVKD
ncbi:aminotransferase class I/II-fold pyridoxal phosphate-dependent enzyme [Synechococcus sp. PCC 7336]|uniref:aminotransferase class I/II-fold pyridoxal phosphate-dependent enzyme n=1 Tax=Synechococcus sp. PCC 7336 TaxID=195250 RepID=UPI00034AD6C9|nr:aminotransferase class I/II-fold pyridoxal phosphate-dependent enzyme [Synechococcus sp. PCC 7336]